MNETGTIWHELWITRNNGITWECFGAESSRAQSQVWDLENDFGIGCVQIRVNGETIA